ncbi:rhombosortase [Hydrocarboniclastica marina]|uniref:Rhombosortase n=1 Tax=Hydrocarboniclastica marina TaxID=2259620 RepID=A0A4P7XLQ6_9ALTE|nr:rhombosortase [Hydrocarboniclastica marina]QCF27504.1 rhombosortase [Hydrocarboniclastica marina]
MREHLTISLPDARTTWSVLLALGMILISLLPVELAQLLQFQNELFEEGEYYRLLTGHFVHLGWMHALLNSIGLVIVIWIFPQPLTLRIGLTSVLFCSIFISFGLLLLSEVAWYRGFSGVLHGLFVIGALSAGSVLRWRLPLMLGLVAKLGYELGVGPDSATAELIGGTVIEAAHWLGAAAGLIVASSLWIAKLKKTEV